LAHLHILFDLSLLNVALEWFISFGLIHKWFKNKCETLKWWPHGISEQGEPEATASFPLPNIHPCAHASDTLTWSNVVLIV